MIAALLAIFISLMSVTSHPEINHDVYTKAVHAWHVEYRHNHSLKPFLTIVDFTKPDDQTRLYIVDMRTGKVVYTGLVAHGIGSGSGSYVLRVSNRSGSKESSVGTFLTESVYYGHNGLSLHLIGLEIGINNNVYHRHIVVHGSRYVNSSYVGHSWGCFALNQNNSTLVINLIKNNSLVFAYFPDKHWLKTSRFLKHA